MVNKNTTKKTRKARKNFPLIKLICTISFLVGVILFVINAVTDYKTYTDIEIVKADAFSTVLRRISMQKILLSGSPCLKTGKKTAGINLGPRIRSKKRSDYIRRWTDVCLTLKNACCPLREKRCACQPMSLIWKTY